MSDYVTLEQIAHDMGLDRSNTRKYILKKGFTFLQVRTKEARGQMVNALTVEDAEAVKETRRKEGFTYNTIIAENGKGYFYVIQLVPELSAARIKVGYASDIQQRLAAHRTASPTAELVKHWPCKITWERAAIDSLTRMGCRLIANEVYDCSDISTLVELGDSFFAIMPKMGER